MAPTNRSPFRRTLALMASAAILAHGDGIAGLRSDQRFLPVIRDLVAVIGIIDTRATIEIHIVSRATIAEAGMDLKNRCGCTAPGFRRDCGCLGQLAARERPG